ncbi:hypothetical protein MKX03_022432 [Papaver bracteatum]|nr:hypothetical protein MKX03_022432 [Papaver bracteatum]
MVDLFVNGWDLLITGNILDLKPQRNPRIIELARLQELAEADNENEWQCQGQENSQRRDAHLRSLSLMGRQELNCSTIARKVCCARCQNILEHKSEIVLQQYRVTK